MKEINLDNIKVDSIVFSKWYGECVVKNITSNKIIVYSKSKNKEVEFDYPNAFYNGYLHIIDETNSPLESNKSDEKISGEASEDEEITSVELSDDEIEPVVLNEEETRIKPLKKRRILLPEVKKDYRYSADNIIDKLVVKNDNTQGSITGYKDRGNNQQGSVDVVFKDRDETTTYMYPSCFVNENLKFISNEDQNLISKDIDIYNENTDEAIARREGVRKEKENLLYNLSQHLSCIEKCTSVEDFCRLYRGAVYQEICYLKTKGNKKYKLSNGKEVAKSGYNHFYSFESENELNLLPDSDIRVYIDDCNYLNGKVISCEDNTITFSSEKLNKNMLKESLISYNNWLIMEQLDKRLYELSKNYNRIVNQLVCGNTEITKHSNLQYGQKKAIEMFCNNPITYIWGPPGTGKTYTLADIVVKLLSQDKRVLMLSHSNVSVDGAIIEVENHLNSYNIGEIIRYGYPKDKSLLSSENLLNSYNLALSKNAKLKDKQKDLLKEKEELNNKIEIYNDIIGKKIKAIKNYEDVNEKLYITNKCITYIQTELNGIRARIKTDEEEIVKSAKFVATTLSKAICDSVIFSQKFDAVIIDEVSMAYTPQVIFAANLAKEHFCCIGDFNQLSPIVQNEDKRNILHSDIFEYCGDLNNMVILNEQRRMHKDIAKFIGSNMYFDLLESHESTENRNKITECEPFADNPITYVDIHSLKSAAKLAGYSHYNIISLLVTVKIAQKAIKKNDYTVGIITPYSEQAKLLNATLRVLLLEDEKDRVTCATVHQFQGSQRDIIIYDAVDAKGQITHPGFLLTASNKENNNVSNRLFNVAMTRAKGKFIVVADREFIDSGLTKGKTEGTEEFKSLFYSLSRHAENNKLIVDAKDLKFLADDTSSGDFITFCSNKEATMTLKKDIKNSKNIRVDVSGKISDKTLTEIYKKYRLNNQIDVEINIDQYINKGIDYKSQVNKKDYILINKTIIDDDIIWLGYNCTKYDNDLCWRIKSQQFIKKIESMKD